MIRVELYTRVNCPLCDEARAELVRHGLRPTLIDVDGDAALRQRFGNCVPVVYLKGRLRFRGRVNEHLLRRLLRREAEHEAVSEEGQAGS